MRSYPPTSFRLSPRERGVLDDLAHRLGQSRAGVLRLAIRALDEKVEEAARDERRAPVATGTAGS